MARKKIFIKLEGMHEDDNFLRLGEFIEQLDLIFQALRQSDRTLSKTEKPTAYYRISKLSLSSPASVAIESIPVDPEKDYSDEVFNVFLNGIRSIIHREERPENFDYQTLEAFRKIGHKIDKGISRLGISSDDESYDIDQTFSSKVQVIQGSDDLVFGSITGRIEAINLHAGVNEFRLFPPVGPERVRCRFPQSDVKKAIESISRWVTVHGTLKYRQHAMYPHEIEVKDIDIHSPSDDLPKLADLKGIAPNLTSGLSSEDFVREIRDAE